MRQKFNWEQKGKMRGEDRLRKGVLCAGHEASNFGKDIPKDSLGRTEWAQPGSAEQINGIKLQQPGGRREMGQHKRTVEGNACAYSIWAVQSSVVTKCKQQNEALQLYRDQNKPVPS